ncbi:Hypothetical protein SCF082_LOCUS20667 [Durusdinium trenchii]|uniref:Uncharacterized protein n=1 Tax=Durusdinium trenchii TaxID=1381693 RepID=A0ABP0L3W7_9DINO
MKQRVVTTLLRFSFFSNLPCVASLRIRRANQSLECLDQKLGNIQNWTKEGNAPLAKDWKETIGRQLREAERETEIDKLVQAADGAAIGRTSASDGTLVVS